MRMHSPYDQMVVERQYDWCFGDHEHMRRTPREYPYSYSPYFLWRDFKDVNRVTNPITSVYSDRMRDWDVAAYDDAGIGRKTDTLSREEAIKQIDIYYRGEYVCVGYGVGANVSNGYPYGLYYLAKTKNRSITSTKETS